MEQKVKRVFRWLVKVLVTVGVLCFLFSKVSFAAVLGSLKNIEPVYLLPVLFFQIVSRYVNALQLRIFTDKQKMGLIASQLMRINFVTQFYGLLLPGELSASLIKWHRLTQKTGMGAQAVACIIFSRIVRTLCLVVIGAVFFLIEMPYCSISVVASLFIGLALFLATYLLIISPTVFSWVERGIGEALFGGIPEWVRIKIRKVKESIKAFHDFSRAALNEAFLLSAFSYFLDVLSVYLIAQALDINVSIISITWIRTVVTIIQMLPISISGLGVREGAFVLLLKQYSVHPSDAMALSFAMFGFSVLMAIIGGIFEAWEFLGSKVTPKTNIEVSDHAET